MRLLHVAGLLRYDARSAREPGVVGGCRETLAISELARIDGTGHLACWRSTALQSAMLPPGSVVTTVRCPGPMHRVRCGFLEKSEPENHGAGLVLPRSALDSPGGDHAHFQRGMTAERC